MNNSYHLLCTFDVLGPILSTLVDLININNMWEH